MDKQEAVARAIGLPVDFDVRGRSITYLILKLVQFWGRHKITLNAVIDSAVATALDQLLTSVLDAMAVNPPGPD
jgi:hypothetical protein